MLLNALELFDRKMQGLEADTATIVGFSLGAL